jgi:phosphatidate cytidylyltransferase
MQKRVLTTLTLGPFLLYLLGIDSAVPAWCVALFVLILSHRELIKMLDHRDESGGGGTVHGRLRLVPWTGLVLLGLFAAQSRLFNGAVLLALGGVFVAPAMVRIVQRRETGPIATDLLTGGWIGCAVAAMILLHEARVGDTHFGWQANCLLLVFLAIWFGDSFAMLVGKRFGKRPLAPKISPGKTVAGAVANVVTQIAVWVIYSLTLLDQPWLTVPTAAGLGLVSATVAQLGDLFESVIKRFANRKDSGGVIPGHGGLLDRFDSLAWTGMVMLVSLEWFRGPAGNVTLW